MNVITTVALDEGVSHFIFIAHTLAVATVVISPFVFFLKETNALQRHVPSSGRSLCLHWLGKTALFQNFYFASLDYTSVAKL